MTEKQLGLREKVKKGKITSEEALSQIRSSEYQGQSIVEWLQFRIHRGVKVEAPKLPAPVPAKVAPKPQEQQGKRFRK